LFWLRWLHEGQAHLSETPDFLKIFIT
jgi:hypothetical protein